MPTANELITPTSIASLGVATLAVNVATNALHSVLKFPPKTTAFVAALVIAFLVVAISNEPPWYAWVVAFFNGCLIFCSAMGLNETTVAAGAGGGKGFGAGSGFFQSWVR